MRSGIRKKLDDLYMWIENNYRAYNRRKQVRKTLKGMNGGNTKNDDKYITEYLAYWKKYNKKPNKMWLRLYAKDNEEFTPRYIPDDLWYGEILPYFCNMQFRRSYEDKCFYDTLFKELNRPKTILKCMAGIYYDGNNKIVEEKDIIDIIKKNKTGIIKPSIDSGTGRLIDFFDCLKDTDETIKNKLNKVGKNYIIQEIVSQHEEMKKLNPNSLNTVRIITFLFKGEVSIISIISRMGRGESKIDNVSAGGLQITVNKDGSFQKYAWDKKRNSFEYHPDTNVKFEGFKIPNFEKIVKVAMESQLKLPHFKLVGWDFAVDHTGEPVFIEYNVCPGSNQMTGGPTFGDLTEEVLQEVYINKTYEQAQN